LRLLKLKGVGKLEANNAIVKEFPTEMTFKEAISGMGRKAIE